MELNILKEFVALAELENYIEASETLFISQSTLSKHIKNLEKEIGVQLFDRTTRKVRLNEYGQVFLEYSRKILALHFQCKAELLSLQTGENNSLTIGSIPIMAPYGITDAILAFKKHNRFINVNIVEGESHDLLKMLDEGKCELAFIREDEEQAGATGDFRKIAFSSDYLVAMLPSYHPLSQNKQLELQELANEDFLFLQPNTVLYQICVKACKKAGFTPNIIYTGQRAENIIDLVEKGMGVSLLMSKPIAYLTNQKVKLIPIVPKIKTNIKIYYKADNELSKAAQHFIDYIQQ